MKLTPEEKARSAAIMRELLGGTKENAVAPLGEPNRGVFYFASFAAIAVGLTLGAAYYFGAWRDERPVSSGPSERSVPAANAAQKQSPLRPSTLPPEAVQPKPTRPTILTYQDPPRRQTSPAPSRRIDAPAYTPPPDRVVEVDRTNEHRQKAQERVAKEGGIVGRIESVEQVAGWTGRFRTTGEATFYRYSGSAPTPKRFEVLTQEEGSTISSVDFTIKW